MINIKLETLGEDVKPKLGKKVKSYKKWKIYKGTNSSGNETYRCFTPDERPEVGYEDWETDTLEQAIEWIDNSDLTESIKLTEGGIYPVALDEKYAIEDFENKLSQILNGNVSVKNLELIPSYGFGGPGVYWYRCDIDLGYDVIENLLDPKSTPIAYNANENNDLMIYMPSVSVECSHDNDYNVYVDLGTYGGFYNDNKLKDEENIISNKIIDILKNNESDLVELLKDYELSEDDNYYENLIPIKESAFDDEYIIELVKMGFETGYQLFDDYDSFINDEDIQDIEDKDAAWDLYNELIDMGPSEFYKTYKGEYDFDPDFINKYGERDIEENLISINKVTEDFKSNVCNPRFIYNLLDNICEISNSYDDFDLDTDCENILSVIDNIEDKLYELKSIIELCQK